MKLVMLTAIAAVCLASPAMAQWTEVGDAGDLPGTAQVPTCAAGGGLTSISGNLTDSDADMYCIHINGQSYAANACGTGFDTQLFLFRQDGSGVAHNDDSCGLQSALGGIQPGPGDYLLAISGYNHDPLNGQGQAIWANSPFDDETPPDGAGGNIASWGGAGAGGPYTLNLLDVSCCGVTAVEPATWGKIKSIYHN